MLNQIDDALNLLEKSKFIVPNIIEVVIVENITSVADTNTRNISLSRFHPRSPHISAKEQNKVVKTTHYAAPLIRH